jgi:LacI family transcriptional regulator, galactose operon repressor
MDDSAVSLGLTPKVTAAGSTPDRPVVEARRQQPPRQKARPTMSDVAAAAGVSLKTVSRVVNEEPAVTPETHQRVMQAIDELGYRRNDVARSLRQGQVSRTIGLVIEDVANPFYSAITRGVEEETRARGLLVIASSSDEDPVREKALVSLLCERRVDGLLIVPAGTDHRYLLPEIDRGTPAVFIDRPPGEIEADMILLDNVGGALMAVKHLIAHGHRRIAFVADALSIATAKERSTGYEGALATAGIDVDPELVRTGLQDEAAAETAVRELLGLPDPPTAIFSGNNRLTVGALRALASRPGVALIGFDDTEAAEFASPPLSVISYDAAELGRRAARMLLERLSGEEGPWRRVVLETRLIARGSGEVPA